MRVWLLALVLLLMPRPAGAAAWLQPKDGWQVIANVKWQGPMTQGALAEHIGTHAASMSRLIDQLEGKGLLRRVGHASDRRRITVELTPRGEAWYARTHVTPMAELHAVMSRLNRAEQGQLERLLLKLVR